MKQNHDPKRHYKLSDLPSVTETVDAELTAAQREVLKTLYSEVANTWRALMDVRFKLLALVPFVSVGVLVVLLPGTGSKERLHGLPGRSIAAVGFVVTLGLLIYELRNSELYDDLISRGRRIEAELGIHTGMFRGRPNAKHRFINHSTAIFLIYAAALAGWSVAFFLVG
jgi:hypothetical protein